MQYYRLIDRKRVDSSRNIRQTINGQPVSNFTTWLSDLPDQERIDLGWYSNLVSPGIPEPIEGEPEKRWLPTYHIDGDSIVLTWVEDLSVIEKPMFQLSKIKIRQTLRDMGLEQLLSDLLDSDEALRNDWLDAVTLDSNNPMIIGAFDQLEAAGLLTSEQTEQILEASRSEYQT